MQEVQSELKNELEIMQEEAKARALESLRNTLKEIEANEKWPGANGGAKDDQENANFLRLVKVRRLIAGEV